MKTIPLANSTLVARISDKDFALVSRHKWHVFQAKGQRQIYAKSSRTTGNKYMHRLICPGATKVDHRDCDGLNNTRRNLRPANNRQHAHNVRKRLNCSSRFKGVYWKTKEGVWQASIGGYKRKYLGRFQNEIEAAEAYNRAAKKAYGRFAHLNVIPKRRFKEARG